MEYYIKTNDLEEITELQYGIEKGDNHNHKGKNYIVEKIRIVEPEKGIVYLFCKENRIGKKANLTAIIR